MGPRDERYDSIAAVAFLASASDGPSWNHNWIRLNASPAKTNEMFILSDPRTKFSHSIPFVPGTVLYGAHDLTARTCSRVIPRRYSPIAGAPDCGPPVRINVSAAVIATIGDMG